MNRSRAVAISVPGKLFLMGEHAVVYGFPCLVSSLDRYMSIRVSFSEDGRDYLDFPEGTDRRFVSAALGVFRKQYGLSRPVTVKTDGGLSGFGLGSSSGCVLGVLRGLTELHEMSSVPGRLFSMGYDAVCSIQKTGSGADLASQIRGYTIWFNGKTKKIRQISTEPLPILAVYSGIKGDTVSMIHRVRNLWKTDRKNTEALFRQIALLTSYGKNAIEKKDWITLGSLFSRHHQCLQSLGVSRKQLDILVNDLCTAGAYGAKLSGAGGGDCVLAVSDSRSIRRIVSYISGRGYQVVADQVGQVSGVLGFDKSL